MKTLSRRGRIVAIVLAIAAGVALAATEPDIEPHWMMGVRVIQQWRRGQ